MEMSKAIKWYPEGINRVMEVGGPSVLTTTLKTTKVYKEKSDKNKQIGKKTIITKELKHALRSPVSGEFVSSSSEYSDFEIASIWTDNKTPSIKENHKQSETCRAKPALQLLQMYTDPKWN
jgi:hypothetical protein